MNGVHVTEYRNHLRSSSTACSLLLNTMLYPLELAKVHQQVDCNLASLGLFATLDHVWKLNGGTGYFQGFPLSLASGWLNDFLVSQLNSLFVRLVGGPVYPIWEAMNQLAAHVITYPLTVLRTRFMILPTESPKNRLESVREIVERDPGALFRGVFPSTLQGVVRLGCNKVLASFQLFPNRVYRLLNESEPAWLTIMPLVELAIDALAYPFGTVARIMEVQHMPTPKHHDLTAHSLIRSDFSLEALRQIINRNGYSALWAGFGTSTIAILSVHGLLTAYVYAKHAFRSQ